MSTFQIFSVVVLFFGSSCADFACSDTKIHDFGSPSDQGDVAESISASISAVDRYTADPRVVQYLNYGADVVSVVPLLGTAAGAISIAANILSSEVNWQDALSREVAKQIDIAAIKSTQEAIKSKLDLMTVNIKYLGESNPIDVRKNTANKMWDDCFEVLSRLGNRESLLKKYPLIGCPIAIVIANFIITIELLIKATKIPKAFDKQLSCQIRDILLQYRQAAVTKRLGKFNGIVYDNTEPLSDDIAPILHEPYNANGYNKTAPCMLISCDKGCPRSYDKDINMCIHDEFSTDSYFTSNVKHLRESCAGSLAGNARHHLEKTFSVEILDKLCSKPPPTKPTGYGWLSMNIGKVVATTDVKGGYCDSSHNDCDSYLIFKINGKRMFTTATKDGTPEYILNRYFTHSTLIPKTSKLTFELWDKDSVFGGADDLILRKTATIEEFMANGIILGTFGVLYGGDSHQSRLEVEVYFQEKLQLV